MRRFWLKKNNSIWDLSSAVFDNSKSFMSDPQGLGVNAKIDSFEVERVVFIEKVRLKSSEISGRLYFRDYTQFTAFAEFIGYIETSEPLRLYYSTAEQKPDYNSNDEIGTLAQNMNKMVQSFKVCIKKLYPDAYKD